MLRTNRALRLLGPADLRDVTGLIARDPVVNVVADYRARTTNLNPRWLGGEMWGYYEADRLVSVCHSAANLIPVMATPAAIELFAERSMEQGRRCSTIVGPEEQVDALWDWLRPTWTLPRDVRPHQPHMEIGRAPSVDFDPYVRRSTMDDLDLVYPAAVAMYTEEVGVSPESGGGASAYQARMAQLISRRWSFMREEQGRVVFKAEIAAATEHACQVQGVWVAPDRRGQGLAVSGMAAVVDLALRDVAPVVSLYVNAHNHVARAVYERVGFRQTASFTTVLF